MVHGASPSHFHENARTATVQSMPTYSDYPNVIPNFILNIYHTENQKIITRFIKRMQYHIMSKGTMDLKPPHFGIKDIKHLLLYETYRAATESPVYTYENDTIDQAFYRIKTVHGCP